MRILFGELNIAQIQQITVTNFRIQQERTKRLLKVLLLPQFRLHSKLRVQSVDKVTPPAMAGFFLMFNNFLDGKELAIRG